MNTVLTWTATDILGLSEAEPARLFPVPPGEREGLFRRLMFRWHPDRNPAPEASAVCVRIGLFYGRLAGDALNPDTDRRFVAADGREFLMRAPRFVPFELGEVGLGQRHLFWQIRPEFRDCFERSAVDFPFADTAMAAQMRPCLPDTEVRLWGTSGGLWVQRRPEGHVRLRSMLDKMGPLDPRHVAWMMSALHHLLCYLSYAGLVHHGITTDNLWVHPEKHRMALWGGWFYAARTGQPVTVVPAAALDALPRAYLEAKRAHPDADDALMRALGRELLGDRTGMRLMRQPDLPVAMRDALCLPATGSAPARYAAWKAALLASFGTPRFVKFDVPPDVTD